MELVNVKSVLQELKELRHLANQELDATSGVGVSYAQSQQHYENFQHWMKISRELFQRMFYEDTKHVNSFDKVKQVFNGGCMSGLDYANQVLKQFEGILEEH